MHACTIDPQAVVFLLHDDYSRSRYALLFKNVLSCHVSTNVVSTDHVKTDISGHAETISCQVNRRSPTESGLLCDGGCLQKMPQMIDGTADARPSVSQIKANTGVYVIKVFQDQHDFIEHLVRLLSQSISSNMQSVNAVLVNNNDNCGSATCTCGSNCACKPGECKC